MRENSIVILGLCVEPLPGLPSFCRSCQNAFPYFCSSRLLFVSRAAGWGGELIGLKIGLKKYCEYNSRTAFRERIGENERRCDEFTERTPRE